MPIFFHARSTEFGAYEQQRVQAPTLTDLFTDLESYVAKIPVEDRWDMYYSLAETRTPRKRDKRGEDRGAWAKENWLRQEALAWDIDAVLVDDLHKAEAYSEVMAEFVGCEPHEMSIIMTGHGFHFLFFLGTPIEDFGYFEKNRRFYKAGLEEISKKLRARGLSGKPDPAVFDLARILRLPGTENRKREPHVVARTLQLSLVKHSINLAEILGLPVVEDDDALSDSEVAQIHRAIDVETVLSGCQFLAWTRDHAEDVKEPEGYAALSILGRFPDQQKTAREYYARWKNSSSLMRAEPGRKIEQAVAASGPRTCQSIHATWAQGPGCATCPHFGKVKSPILITGKDFIATEGDGFYHLIRDKKGQVKERRPAYDDLLKAFVKEKHYFSQPETEQIWAWTGTHYRREFELSVKGWCESKMDPKPQTNIRNEFYNKITVNQLKPQSEFEPLFQATIGKINMRNGVLDVKTRTLSPHSPQYGFKYVLPYDYDASAVAPKFQEFLSTLMLGRQELIDALLDFLGYCLWPGYEGVEPAFWWLAGGGSNGKSRFIEMAEKMLGGIDNSVHLKPRNFKDTDRFALGNLDGKLLCVVEEVNEKFLGDDMLGVLKDLCSGGTISVEAKGKPHWDMKNTAKFVFTSNKQPVLEDTTQGLQRRFIVVPFDMDFEKAGSKKDPQIVSKMIHELPGILNLALAALDRMVERGYKPLITEASRRELENMVLASDSVERWARERLLVTDNEDDFTPTKELYYDYERFMEGEGKVSRNTFTGRMRKKVHERFRDRQQKKFGGVVHRGFFGVKLLSPSDLPY
jgi:P4 family phage/plasmid primase-like protien